MVAPVLEETRELSAHSSCQHYWVLESPVGETSRGTCKRCGADRQFRNSLEEFVGEEERSANLTYWGSGDMCKFFEYT